MKSNGTNENLLPIIGGTAGGFSLVELASALPPDSFFATYIAEIVPFATGLFFLFGIDLQKRLKSYQNTQLTKWKAGELKEIERLVEQDTKEQLDKLLERLNALPEQDKMGHQEIFDFMKSIKKDEMANLKEISEKRAKNLRDRINKID